MLVCLLVALFAEVEPLKATCYISEMEGLDLSVRSGPTGNI